MHACTPQDPRPNGAPDEDDFDESPDDLRLPPLGSLDDGEDTGFSGPADTGFDDAAADEAVDLDDATGDAAMFDDPVDLGDEHARWTDDTEAAFDLPTDEDSEDGDEYGWTSDLEPNANLEGMFDDVADDDDSGGEHLALDDGAEGFGQRPATVGSDDDDDEAAGLPPLHDRDPDQDAPNDGLDLGEDGGPPSLTLDVGSLLASHVPPPSALARIQYVCALPTGVRWVRAGGPIVLCGGDNLYAIEGRSAKLAGGISTHTVDGAVHPDDASVWMIATADGSVLRSRDAGATTESVLQGDSPVSLSWQRRSDHVRLWCLSEDGNLRYSDDCGDRFSGPVHDDVVAISTLRSLPWLLVGLRGQLQIGRLTETLACNLSPYILAGTAPAQLAAVDGSVAIVDGTGGLHLSWDCGDHFETRPEFDPAEFLAASARRYGTEVFVAGQVGDPARCLVLCFAPDEVTTVFDPGEVGTETDNVIGLSAREGSEGTELLVLLEGHLVRIDVGGGGG